MVLPEREKATGGKVDEGHRGASGGEDGAGRARRGRVAEGGGHWGRMAGRGAGGRGGAVRIGPMGRDRWGGWEGEQSEGSEGAEGALWPPVLPYRAEEGERDRVEEGASGFGLPILAVPTAGQPIGRATGQRGAFAAYPPHPSPPPPSAGGHTLFLKGAPLKNFSGFSKWENALSPYYAMERFCRFCAT